MKKKSLFDNFEKFESMQEEKSAWGRILGGKMLAGTGTTGCATGDTKSGSPESDDDCDCDEDDDDPVTFLS
ncbi:hypothetical protein [Marinoscillum pacificum]|uniref:hypothetical protein n=1 Tax=Marinoscillum pacificum TaxID=392723 RepID=UPI0021580B0C|nr:hypothetical protein [Marinoscillum pacificum]